MEISRRLSTLLVRNLPSMMNIFKGSQHEISESLNDKTWVNKFCISRLIG